MKKFLLITGPSGSGKSEIERQLSERDFDAIRFHKLKQVTTRKMREGESQSDPYMFLTQSEYDDIADKLIAKSVIVNPTGIGFDYYGTLNDSEDAIDINGKFVINTVIVNKKGYENIIHDIHKLYGESYDVYTICISNPEPVEREGRDIDHVAQELSESRSICDYELENYPGNWLDLERIIDALYNRGFFDAIQ